MTDMSKTRRSSCPTSAKACPTPTIVEWLVKVGDTVRLDDAAGVDGNRQGRGRSALAVLRQGAASCAGGAGDVIVTGAMLAEFELDPSAAAARRRPGHRPPPRRRPQRAPAAGADEPARDDRRADDGDRVRRRRRDQRRSRAEGRAKRDDAGTVVGAMQSSDAVRSEQAVAVGGVKAMPAVRALAKKLGVDLARVRATGADGVVTMDDVKHAAADGSAQVGAAPAARAARAAARRARAAAPQRAARSRSRQADAHAAAGRRRQRPAGTAQGRAPQHGARDGRRARARSCRPR